MINANDDEAKPTSTSPKIIIVSNEKRSTKCIILTGDNTRYF